MLDTECVQKVVDREVVEIMSKVCQKLSSVRVNLSNLFKDNPEDYFKFREAIFDCEELMSTYCDCAPLKLIAGQVDDIMGNLNKRN